MLSSTGQHGAENAVAPARTRSIPTPVRSASAWQARQPVHARSIGRWCNYQALASDWFEQIVVFPVALALGNVLSTQERTIELYNAFRRPRVNVDWTTFTNNVGVGVSVTNLPGLPFSILATESFIATVSISTAGPPAISGTLDFGFGPPQSTITIVPVTGNRITIFQYRPQAPINEQLEFKTDILRNNDGSEQRIKVRGSPRQIIEFTVRTDDDITRDKINSVLFDWQARVFGLPIWWEVRDLDQDIIITATTIDVVTADADFEGLPRVTLIR